MIKLKVTWMYCLALYFITMLYSSLHELVHHFAGYLICGSWGYKTFNYFKISCGINGMGYTATYAGPLFTFAVLWIGAWMLKNKNSSIYRKHFAFALIFAQMPAQRMAMAFFKMNDEYSITAKLFGHTTFVYWIVIIVIWAICIPPLVVAYKSIQNRYKLLWFLFYLLLFPYLLWGHPFVLLEYMLVDRHIMDGTIIGITNLFILNEVVTVVGYYMTKKFLYTG